MTDRNLIEWLERREAAWAWLVAFPKSHRETSFAERQAYNEQSRAFCQAEDAILTELRQRGRPFVFQGRRFSADVAGLMIELLDEHGAVQVPAKGRPARGGAA